MSIILSIGEVLWDIFPDGAHLGGAPFNFAANCARLGHHALFFSALGDDELGQRAREAIEGFGVATEFIQRTAEAATGIVQVEFDSEGQPHYTIQRPAAYDFLRADRRTVDEIVSRHPDIVYFGSLSQTYPNNLEALTTLLRELSRATRFCDVNLRQDFYSGELLRQLLEAADIVKFNEAETRVVQSLFGTNAATLEQFCRDYGRQFGWRAVCVTRGAEGCAVLMDERFVEARGFPVDQPSPVGAGDAFAAAFCHGISEAWPVEEIADFANRVGALVAGKTEAVSNWTMADCYRLTRGDRTIGL
jgi:fructokinase